MKIWKKSDKIFWVLNHIGSTFGYLIQVEFLDFNLYKRLNIEFVYYSRKLQHRSKIHAEGRRNTETENRKPSDDTILKQEEPWPERNGKRSI